MIDRSFPLYQIDKGGRIMISDTDVPGARLIKQKGNLLTMTAKEAIETGLTAGIADGPGELGILLGHKDWEQCEGIGSELGEYAAQRENYVTSQWNLTVDRMSSAVKSAISADPWGYRDYVYWGDGSMKIGSAKIWEDRAKRCSVAMDVAERQLDKASMLTAAYPYLLRTEGDIDECRGKLIQLRASIHRGPQIIIIKESR
jgi:hypothetical protein